MTIEKLILPIGIIMSAALFAGCTSANSEQTTAQDTQEVKIETLATQSDVINAATAHLPDIEIGE